MHELGTRTDKGKGRYRGEKLVSKQQENVIGVVHPSVMLCQPLASSQVVAFSSGPPGWGQEA